ncbi:MAG TPA: hypothetical protein PK303_08260 [bacterium]|nr:hypothetical protein [bacterium]HOL35742.1 hypothetical protein [bacterium]HPP09096.1 hypothetical protein [bacterium]
MFVAGAGTRKINCKIGDSIMGQLHIRKCQYIMDDLESNCVFLSDGTEKILLISCDLALLLPDFVERVKQSIEKKTSIAFENIYLFCTHTHTGPNTVNLLPDDPTNSAYLDELETNLVQLTCEVISSAVEAKLGYGKGSALIGYNRRVCWRDGSHTMYGDTRKKEFAGIEGPEDPTHCVISIVDKQNHLIAIIYNNACHCTCVESGNFASADFPGESRKLLRQIFDNQLLPVLYLQGASGDLSPWNLMKPLRCVSGVQRMKEIGAICASETAKIIANMEYQHNPVIKNVCEKIKIKIRMPEKDEIKRARKIVEKGEEKEGRWNYVLNWSILKLYEEYKNKSYEEIPVGAIRIDNCAIATIPYEYYCQFGIDIRRRSPAQVTLIAQLANGWYGYCPTIYGVLGGGYSGMTIYWTRHQPEAGYIVADACCRLLYQLWK